MGRPKIFDTAKIREDFINGFSSLLALAQESGVSYSHLSKLASSEKWAAKRKDRRASAAEAAETLSRHSVPCSPVNTVKQAASDPHMTEREIMMEVPDPVAGTMWVTGKMIKFSRTPMVVGTAPAVGQHTLEVLTDILGYSAQKARALRDDGVVAVAETEGPSAG